MLFKGFNPPSEVRYFTEECDSFCIVRDPLERMISQLKFVFKLDQVRKLRGGHVGFQSDAALVRLLGSAK